jgi:hypothetical protein
MGERLRTAAAWGTFGVVVVLAAGTLVIMALTEELELSPVLDLLNSLLTCFIGALIVTHQWRNPIGWILLGVGAVLALSNFAEPFTQWAWSIGFDTVTGALPVLWVAQWAWILPTLGVVLLLLLFPTGQPLTPRWRWVIYGSIAVFLLLISFLALLSPFELETLENTTVQIQNPVGLILWQDTSMQVGLLFALLIVPLVLSLVSMFLRFVRASGVERQQLKWFLYAAALFIVALTLSFTTENPLAPILVTIVSLGLPLAVAIALFRYRLYDIDLIIRRTLTYALVVILLALVYFGSVILLQQIFASLTGQRSEIITVLSTLAIAVLFIPLRNLTQKAIDKRFNRSKYDAQRVLMDFSETVRDETDLERLSARLLQVVNETMQPKSLSVWLKKDKSG